MTGWDGTGPPEVVRARRFELVDAEGAVRAIVGDLGGGGGVFGVALVGRQGEARVWIELGEQGPALVFDQGGNDVVAVGVHDAVADALHVGAYLQLSHADGRPALGWRVEDDGSVTMRAGGPER
ncbi:MAG: hypothetical protein M3N68_11505 [Actinomycetota bacterium]|nr:hypothetical protein [Actinomycetota bacterium]